MVGVRAAGSGPALEWAGCGPMLCACQAGKRCVVPQRSGVATKRTPGRAHRDAKATLHGQAGPSASTAESGGMQGWYLLKGCLAALHTGIPFVILVRVTLSLWPMMRSGVPYVTGPSPLLDPLCLAAFHTYPLWVHSLPLYLTARSLRITASRRRGVPFAR
eukprot:361335-Chlamydomonas_euryale.AAC.9